MRDSISRCPALRRIAALAALLLLAATSCSRREELPIGVVLVCEPDAPAGSFDREQLIQELDERLNGRPPRRALVRADGAARIEVAVVGYDESRARWVERQLAVVEPLELRLLANPQRDASLLDEAGRFAPAAPGDARPPAQWVEVAEPFADEVREHPDLMWRESEGHVLEVLVLNDPHDVATANIERVWDAVDDLGRPCVQVVLDEPGADAMAALLAQSDSNQPSRRLLGAIVEGRLRTLPLTDGVRHERAWIVGNFSDNEVHDLVHLLRLGPPACPLRIVARRSGE